MIKESINNYLTRSGQTGKILSEKELESLNKKLNGLIPNWFIEVITETPLAGLEVGWQAFPPEEDYDGVEWVTLLDAELLSECNIDSYPGSFLWPLGYFTFGYGAAWAGNCFAFNPQEGEDPAVYEVWHDTARNTDEMIKAFKENKGVKKVSESFSGFFDNAIT